MDYIKYIRDKVGSDTIILNGSGCIIVNESGDILLHKRRDCEQWGFMGGFVELGEFVEETAVREVFEESGVHVKIDSLFGVYSKYFTEFGNGDKAQVIVHVFIAHETGGEMVAENAESLEVRYFDVNNLPPMFCKQHQDILDDYVAGKMNVYR